MIPAAAAVAKVLVANGVPLLANALLAKGKEIVEEKTGIKIPDLQNGTLTNEQLFLLKKAEIEKQEALLALALEEKRIEREADKVEMQEVTKRHVADMTSDSWMSKNVRPMVLIYLLTAYALFASASAFGVEVKTAYVELLATWGMLVMSFYFGGRTVEKIMALKGGQK